MNRRTAAEPAWRDSARRILDQGAGSGVKVSFPFVYLRYKIFVYIRHDERNTEGRRQADLANVTEREEADGRSVRRSPVPRCPPPVPGDRVRRGGGSLHPAPPVPRRDPRDREAHGTPGRRARAAGGARGAPGGGPPRQPVTLRAWADSTGSRPIPASTFSPGSAWWCSCSRWGSSRRSGTSCAWGSPRSSWRCWASPRPSPSGGWSGPGSFPGIPGRPTPSSGPPCAPRASGSRRASSRTSGNPAARRRGSSSGPPSSTTSSG